MSESSKQANQGITTCLQTNRLVLVVAHERVRVEARAQQRPGRELPVIQPRRASAAGKRVRRVTVWYDYLQRILRHDMRRALFVRVRRIKLISLSDK